MGIDELLRQPPHFNFVECNVGGSNLFKMFLGGRDDGVALRFLWNGEYEAHTLNLWTKLSKSFKEDTIILDVGAHTGSYTLAALSVTKSTVVAFEPYNMNFARLKMNVDANGFPSNNLFMAAVSDVKGTTQFSVNTEPNYLSAGGKIDDKGGYTVSTILLDDIIKDKATVRMIKLDTEGHEDKCLRGAEDIVKIAKPVIFFESIESDIGNNVEQFLKSNEYNIFQVDDRAKTLNKVDSVKPCLDHFGRPEMHLLNRIAIHKSENPYILDMLI
jgi:FkbM family methyltransferase